jgi:uncharacterized membrane protein
MDWNRRYLLGRYLRSALWIVPFFAIVLDLILVRVLHSLDQRLGWTGAGFGISGARALLEAVVTLTLSFLVFTFGSLLVAIQVASGQLTPRIIATTLLSDRLVRYAVGLFVLSLLFAVGALGRLETQVHQLTVLVAGVLGIACIAAFLFLIDYAAKMLRPVSVVTSVGGQGLAVIESVYPIETTDRQERRQSDDLGPAERIVPHVGASQIVVAVHVAGLLAMARAADGVIEFIPSVGDFVAKDEPLFALYGHAAVIDDRRLHAQVAFGPERTMDQDPTFAFRILIDIALKALSPAINDPTTAVLALDEIHRLLRTVGQRRLRTDEMSDEAGGLRVILRTPNWDDFVHMAFSEIRHCGRNSLQVVRRMRAMIENLMQTLPKHRYPALREQLGLLDRDVQAQFPYAEDLALARTPDSQGLGGPQFWRRGTQERST